MRYRKLDANGDYSFGGNSNNFLTDKEAVRQAVITRLRLLLYEWWENLEDGLPLWQQIMAQRDRNKAEQVIRERMVQTPHVMGLISFQRDWNNETRSLTITALFQTEYGEVGISEVM